MPVSKHCLQWSAHYCEVLERKLASWPQDGSQYRNAPEC